LKVQEVDQLEIGEFLPPGLEGRDDYVVGNEAEFYFLFGFEFVIVGLFELFLAVATV